MGLVLAANYKYNVSRGREEANQVYEDGPSWPKGTVDDMLRPRPP